jgi:hypothetical protein
MHHLWDSTAGEAQSRMLKELFQLTYKMCPLSLSSPEFADEGWMGMSAFQDVIKGKAFFPPHNCFSLNGGNVSESRRAFPAVR